MRLSHRLAATGLALLALACGTAYAQRAPVYQSGVLSASGGIAKFYSNGLIGDGSGLMGDLNGRGLAPFSVTDALGLGLCSNTGLTSAAYWALCLGHDSTGNALLTVDAYGGAAEKSFLIRKNGTLYEFPFTLAGIVGPATTVTGNAAAWNNGVGSLLRDEGAPPGLVVPTNAALKLLVGAAGRRVVRSGFTTIGDGGGGVPYVWSASNCVAADDGKQVQPTAITGCWIADFAGLKPTPRMWGAVGNGVANDHAPLQAAINAMANNTLYLGPHMYKVNSTVSAPLPMRIVGEGRSSLGQFYSGIKAGVPNLNPILAAGEQSYYGHFSIDAGAAGLNTSGTAISTAVNSGNDIFDSLWIYKPCIGIDLNGGSQTITDTRIDDAAGIGCGGIRVGNLTQGGLTVDPRIVNVTVASDVLNRASFGLRIHDAGGLFLVNSDFLFSLVGTEILPGLSGLTQRVEWAFFSNTVIGDSTLNQGLVINTLYPTAIIRGLVFNNTWTATSIASEGISIANAGGASLFEGIAFVGHRSYNNFLNGATVGAGEHTSFDAVRICGNGNGAVDAIGILIQPTIGLTSIRNSTISNNCDTYPSYPGFVYGVHLAGSNAGTIITGNEIYGTTAAILGVPTGASVVANNVGVDTAIGVIASATTIDLFSVEPAVGISGTTPIQTINGGWVGRDIKLISTTGAVPYITGGNICNAVTSASLGMVRGFKDGSCWRMMN